MSNTKKLPRTLKYVVRGLPLAGAADSVSLPLSPFGRQFMVLIVLVWIQVYFIFDIFPAGK